MRRAPQRDLSQISISRLISENDLLNNQWLTSSKNLADRNLRQIHRHFYSRWCGLVHDKLVANSWKRSPEAAALRKAATGEQRVLAGGVPSHHSPNRTTLRTTAVQRCWRWILASPRSRDRRRPQRRMPCACVASTPARRAYWAVNAAVSCRCRAAWIASCWACGRTVSWRGASFAQVHAWRAGQARQVARSTRMRTTGSPDTSRPGSISHAFGLGDNAPVAPPSQSRRHVGHRRGPPAVDGYRRQRPGPPHRSDAGSGR
jgi:hypothetical protein